LTSLESEYINDTVYLTKVQDLSIKYKCMRRARPDGNCFFRSFAFAYFEYLIDHNEEYKHFKERALKSKDELISCGFTQFTLEDFHDTVNFNYSFVKTNLKPFYLYYLSLWKW